jgi:putative phosphoesterase
VRIALISDTHGLVRPEALELLRGADHILHAGDIDRPEVLDALRAVAPLTAVRGNNDRGPWVQALRETEVVAFAGVEIHLIHQVDLLATRPAAGAVVVAGHSHKPAIETRNGVLYVNPGSAGPRRFSLPISLGFLEVEGGKARARLAQLRV